MKVKMNKKFIDSLVLLEKEKGISKKSMIEAVERALASAYNGRNKENIIVTINPNTGAIEYNQRKTIVEEVVDPSSEVSLEEVLEYDPDYEIGDSVDYDISEEELDKIAILDKDEIVAATIKQAVSQKEFINALDALGKEKGIATELLLEAVERALVSAYKGKNKDAKDNVIVNINPKTGEIEIHHRRTVVEEVLDPSIEISLEEALAYDPDYLVGDVVDFPAPLEDLGRIAAQTAKQVVVQAVREIERGMIYDEYIERQGDILTGVIQRVSNDTVFINLGRTEAIMSIGEQVKTERYSVNSRMKFYLMDVKKTQKGPQIFMSRSHPGLVKKLFEIEVPEIMDGIVVIENLSREAGSRTKMTVSSTDESVDPVGACVGNRGARVQTVVDELFGEKIDIITWSDDLEENISNALSPAKVEKIVIDEEENAAIAVVPDYQLSLAIGKEGQNVRLAAKLCGMKIDIKSHTQYFGNTEDHLAGELDDEGYLNPADFIDDVDEEVTEEVVEAAVEELAEDVLEAEEILEAEEAVEEAIDEESEEAE